LDLTLSNAINSLVKCDLYDETFGSDHRAPASEWSLCVERKRTPQARKSYERTN